MSRQIVKKNEVIKNNGYQVPDYKQVREQQYVDRPSNSSLRPVNNTPHDITYVDVTQRNKIRKIHLSYIVAVIVSGFLGFYAAGMFTKTKLSPGRELAYAAINNKLQVNAAPRVNSFDTRALRDEIHEKYDRARESVTNKHFEEAKAKSRNTQNFYSSEEYYQMKRIMNTARIELDGQEAIELCEKTQSATACQNANDFKNSKAKVGSSNQ